MSDVDRLRAAGLRVTSARLAILVAVRAGTHPSVDEVAQLARDRVGHLTIQAVYEALSALAAAGLVRRVEPAGSPARYEGRVGDNHHHIVCRHCGAITDVDCAVGYAPCLELTPAERGGFRIDETEVTFWGLCERCQQDPSTEKVASGGGKQ